MKHNQYTNRIEKYDAEIQNKMNKDAKRKISVKAQKEFDIGV